MTYELDNAVEALAGLIAEITNIAQCDTEEPIHLKAGPGTVHAYVRLGSGELGQIGAGVEGETHTLEVVLLRQIHGDRTGVEEQFRRLLSDVKSKIRTNITLGGVSGVVYAIVTGRYEAGYRRWDGQTTVRELAIPVQVTIRESVTWSQE